MNTAKLSYPNEIVVADYDADGLPTLPILRRVAQRMIARVYTAESEGSASERKWIIENHYKRPSRYHKKPEEYIIHANRALDILVHTGKIIQGDDGTLRYPHGTFRDRAGRTKEERQERYSIYLNNLVERLLPDGDDDTRERLRKLFLTLRHLARIFETETDLTVVPKANRYMPEYAFFVPHNFALTEDKGVVIDKGTAFILSHLGHIQIHHLERHEITTAYKDGGSQVTIKINETTRTRIKQSDYAKRNLLPKRMDWVRTFNCFSYSTNLSSQLAVARKLIGDTITEKNWRKFVRALDSNKRTDIGRIASIKVWQALDPERRTKAMRDPRTTVATYNWLCGRTPQARLRRRQASDAWPWLTRVMVEDSDITKAIDEGRELMPLLQQFTELTPAFLRRTRSVTWQKMARFYNIITSELMENAKLRKSKSEKPPYSVVAILNAIPPEKVPVLRADWNALEVFCKIAEKARIELSPHQAEMVKSASKKWLSFKDKALPDCVRDACRDITTNVIGACYLKMVEAGVPKPADTWMWTYALIYLPLIVGGSNVSRLVDVSSDWHTQYNDLLASLAGMPVGPTAAKENLKPPPTFWMALDDEFTDSRGGKIQWLTNPAELLLEGRTMHHCVGGYSESCLYNGSHIGAITGANGGRSTIELSVLYDRKKKTGVINVLQNYTYCNERAPADCVFTLNEFLATRQSEIDFKAIDDARRERVKLRPNGRNQTLYRFDHTYDLTAEMVLDLYRPFLANPYKKMSREQLATEIASMLIQNGRRH
jgi:hypothetical protein